MRSVARKEAPVGSRVAGPVGTLGRVRSTFVASQLICQ
jgi:hypothetical protein